MSIEALLFRQGGYVRERVCEGFNVELVE